MSNPAGTERRKSDRVDAALHINLHIDLDGYETTESGLDYPLYWRRALLSATVTRVLASALAVRDAEELFLAALIQDIGMLALDRTIPELYGTLGESQVHQSAIVAHEIEPSRLN